MAMVANTGQGGGEVIGYNFEEAQKVSNDVIEIGRDVIENLRMTLLNEVVMPMSEAWYAPAAVGYFEQFANSFSKSANSVMEAFCNFNLFLSDAVERWGQTAGGTYGGIITKATVHAELNVKCMQPNKNGTIYIDEVQANNVINKLGIIKQNVKQDLQKRASEVNAKTSFLGRGQAEAVENCFVKVSRELDDIFDYLAEGEYSLQNQIKKVIDEYGQTATTNTSQFNNM